MAQPQSSGKDAESRSNAKVAAAMVAHTRYLGVDPGLVRTGYAVIERSSRGPQLREAGVIRSKSSLSLAERVHEIASGVDEVLAEYAPEVLVIEQVFSLVRNPKSAILMAHARGAILLMAAQRQIPVVHYPPRQIKRLLTGSGKASKAQMQHATQSELGLKQVLEPHDVADACAVALCHYHQQRLPQIAALNLR